MNGTAVEKYLADLSRELRRRGVLGTRFLEETRGHLTDAIEAGCRGGLTKGVAEESAITSFGDPREVAAKFAAHKYRTLHWVLLVAALALGLAIGWIDSRPHWDDSGITTGLLLLSAALMGLIGPRRPWLWALAIGIWVPLWVPAQAFLETHRIVFDPLLLLFTLAVSMVGAYAGMAVRRLMIRSGQQHA
jgi:hypothetical protein